MRRAAALASVAAALAGCADTLIGAFIEPTHEIASIEELKTLGLSLEPGSPLNPKAMCARSYDREFAPWGEHYGPGDWDPWGGRKSFLESGLSADAIIDVDTGVNDFGAVALFWKSDGKRLKVFIREQPDGLTHLPDGCRMFGEVDPPPAR